MRKKFYFLVLRLHDKDAQIFSIFNHISLIGESKGALRLNSMGIVVFDEGENLKFIKSLISDIFDCMIPNLNAMQFLGPSPVKLIPH
jgi:hypothetical protein